VVDLSDPRRPREIASFVPPSSSPRQSAATAQDGRRDMPVVWGVYPWKDLVLVSDMNSGLWVFRVTADAKASNGGGSGQPATPPPAPQAAPAADRAGDPDTLLWVGVAGLLLGLLALSLVARSARRRQAP
jgi:hypothetical protein